MQLVLRGPQAQIVLLGPERITIGRAPDNDVVVNDPEVSRFHAAIEPLGEAHRIVDLESSNGTYLNGRVVQQRMLEVDDRIAFGHHVATYTQDSVSPQEIGEACLDMCEFPWSMTTITGGLEQTPRAAFNTRLFQALRLSSMSSGSRETEAQQILLQVSLLGQTVSSQVDVYQLLELIIEELLDYTGSRRGILLRYEERAHLLRAVLERRGSGRALASDWAYPVAEVHRTLEAEEPLARFEAEGRSYLCLPLRAPMRLSGRERRQPGPRQKRALGALLFEGGETLPDGDLWLLEAVAAHAASALRHARLQHLATTDVLTGLENRGVMRQVLAEEIHAGGSFVTIMVDIDHFKRINDTHGHAVGDEVLSRIARRLQRSVRQDDYVGRWGGEEFLVILPGEDLSGALSVTRKLSDSISSTPIGEQQICVTASMGVSIYPRHGTRAEVLIDCADRALYGAKRAGRNRVCVYQGDDESVMDSAHRVSG